jgi:hypothetical protein
VQCVLWVNTSGSIEEHWAICGAIGMLGLRTLHHTEATSDSI